MVLIENPRQGRQKSATTDADDQMSCANESPPGTIKPNKNNLTISNTYYMACPPVRGDNTQALANGLSYLQVDEDKHGITILQFLFNH